jgi:hypothetical protein
MAHIVPDLSDFRDISFAEWFDAPLSETKKSRTLGEIESAAAVSFFYAAGGKSCCIIVSSSAPGGSDIPSA